MNTEEPKKRRPRVITVPIAASSNTERKGGRAIISKSMYNAYKHQYYGTFNR
jgi:hypothetical protein